MVDSPSMMMFAAPPAPPDLPNRSPRRSRAALLGILLLSFTAACGSGTEVTPEDTQAIEQTLRSYLPVLAEGYTTGNLEPLQEYAAEKEVARVYRRVSELAEEGKIVEPTFKQMTVEDVRIWGHANALVTTLEVWDLRVYDNGRRAVLGEELDQSNRVKYQLKRRGDRWEVLYRELAQAAI